MRRCEFDINYKIRAFFRIYFIINIEMKKRVDIG